MKKTIVFISALFLSNHAFAVDNAVENIQALCGLAKQGKYSQIQGKAQIQADGSVKLASLGGKGEISFSKGDWDGVQQVLQAHQAGDNKDYRACVANSLPYFKSKVPAAKTTASKPKQASAKSVVSSKAAEPAKVSPSAENVQNIGNVDAEKVVNVNEMTGNLDMGK